MVKTDFKRIYSGPLKAVILDWAGTTVDFGSFAPTAVFIRLFAKYGIQLTPAQARAPMGLMKKDHLRAIFNMPEVAAAWQQRSNHTWSEADLGLLFADFTSMQQEVIARYSDPIPGVIEAVAELRRMGLKIGSTTGYTREMMEILVPAAAAKGYAPDAWVCPSDVPAGRPFPWMCYLNAIKLGVYPMQSMVKVGDTLPDIEEGLNAGMWTIGLAISGNYLGLSKAEVDAMLPFALQQRKKEITASMIAAGAHYVVDGLWDVPGLLPEIEKQIRAGLAPPGAGS